MSTDILTPLLTADDRDFLVDKKGNQTPISDLLGEGKITGVYLSAGWCAPCRSFTPWLSKMYKSVKKAGNEFEIVFVSSDQDAGGFKRYMKKQPWKAIPFEDRATAQKIAKVIGSKLPGFALFDGQGALVDLTARNRIRKGGVAGFPWTEETKASPVEEKKAPTVVKTEEEWKQELSAEEYRVLRTAGTEAAGKGKYTNQLPTKGHYKCRGCNAPLYSAQSKFDSGCGWPAFDACYKGAVATNVDNSHGMVRIEIVCAACNGHLGHVFTGEGHSDTDERHCVNSIGIVYDEKEPEGALTEETVAPPTPAPQEE